MSDEAKAGITSLVKTGMPAIIGLEIADLTISQLKKLNKPKKKKRRRR